jgi:hypothetical protein
VRSLRLKRMSKPKTPQRPVGQRGKLNTETVGVIVEAVARGAYFTDACAIAGVDVSAGYRWQQEADAPSPRPATTGGRWTTSMLECATPWRSSSATP